MPKTKNMIGVDVTMDDRDPIRMPATSYARAMESLAI